MQLCFSAVQQHRCSALACAVMMWLWVQCILAYRWLIVVPIALRARLQSEVSRRQLVEDACDNERRRRKLAEGALDDARREYSQPLVVPAMMDAFEKIAQLTGDAMINAEEPTQAQKDWPMQE